MTNPQTLSCEEESEAKALYEEFWQRHPDIKNPSDINRIEKYNFLQEKGFEKIRLMQTARKQKYEFTRPHENETDED